MWNTTVCYIYILLLRFNVKRGVLSILGEMARYRNDRFIITINMAAGQSHHTSVSMEPLDNVRLTAQVDHCAVKPLVSLLLQCLCQCNIYTDIICLSGTGSVPLKRYV